VKCPLFFGEIVKKPGENERIGESARRRIGEGEGEGSQGESLEPKGGDADKNVRGRQECLLHQEGDGEVGKECRLESLHHKEKMDGGPKAHPTAIARIVSPP
jgi:hypothetical protein